MPSHPRQDPPPFAHLVALELEAGGAPTNEQRRTWERTEATSDGALVTCVHSPDEQAPDTFGLSLSGGGIRSATFNLGLLQELHDQGILRVFDYLSTVSGGGFVGGFWSAWRANSERANAGFPDLTTNPEPAATNSARTEAPEVRHLREYSNFLAPRLGIFSYDTGRLVVAAFSASIPAVLAALSAIAIALAAWLVLGGLLLNGGIGFSAIVLGAVTAAVFVTSEYAWQRGSERSSMWYVAAAVAATVITSLIWYGLPRIGITFANLYSSGVWPLPLIAEKALVRDWLTLFAPGAVWLATALALVIARWFGSTRLRHLRWRLARAAFDRVTSRVLFTAAAWGVMALIWVAAVGLFGDPADRERGLQLTGIAGTTAALALIFGTIQKVMSKLPGTHHLGGRMRTWLIPKLPQLVGYATLLGFILTVVAAALWIGERPSPQTGLAIGLSIAGGISVLTLFLFDPNEVGLHSFYRARLARAFLGAWNSTARRQTEENPDDDLPLDKLSPARPLHLICCAANDLSSSDHLANLHRGATSAVLSRVGFSVGSDWVAWPPDSTRIPTLASAVTASAAAFNSHMGSLSMALGPGVTFVMTALNLRLGRWVAHPTHFTRPWYLRPLPGWQFYRELFGFSRANGTHVHLSDGGHFENMGLYELVRRHCRFIIASDCGADGDVSFDDLGNLVRRVREDFGVEIEIDLEPLSPSDKGLARQPMVAGDIHYPNGDTGILLLFKPTLVGNEPPDITQYKRRNAAFPHETTGDQFYDEAQWESYRRLGVHAARTAFNGVVKDCERRYFQEDAQWGARIFAHARMRWQPMPAGLQARLPRIVDRAAELDALLRSTGCQEVLREVYREVNDIDRLVTPRSNGAKTKHKPITLPTDAALADSLHAVRRAILFMEEVFHSENLARTYSHPLYLGLINYFARWAYAPLFRMWWPTLKALYSERFTAFAEERFGLTALPARGAADPNVDAQIVTGLTSDRHGFAMDAWRMHFNREVQQHETVASYELQVRYRSAQCQVQAAQVVARLIDGTVFWDARNFFVPPGLWGIGIGEDFLDRLVHRRGGVFSETGPLNSGRHLLVRIAAEASETPAVRKERADRTQMYRAAGFREVVPRPGPLNGIGLDVDRLADDRVASSRWLVRCLATSACADPQCAPGVPGKCRWELADSSMPTAVKTGERGYASPADRTSASMS
jgi:hypothetical protein